MVAIEGEFRRKGGCAESGWIWKSGKGVKIGNGENKEGKWL
jgi:hypothetical protein